MVILRPKDLKPCKNIVVVHTSFFDVDPGFVVHPSTSELAEKLQVDSQFLSEENYSGIYDESGDYIPQYCDDPEKIPQGGLSANTDPGTAGGAQDPVGDSSPGSSDPSGDDPS